MRRRAKFLGGSVMDYQMPALTFLVALLLLWLIMQITRAKKD
jgi:ribose/xylose/arabinose/galactoside ABC-type transport system permease subunit